MAGEIIEKCLYNHKVRHDYIGADSGLEDVDSKKSICNDGVELVYRCKAPRSIRGSII